MILQNSIELLQERIAFIETHYPDMVEYKKALEMSAQAIESEKYAAWDGTVASANHTLTDSDKERIARMADIEGAEILEVVFESDAVGGEGASSNHGYYTIVGITVKFENITVTLADGIWTVIQ